jgi:hypothetical protein
MRTLISLGVSFFVIVLLWLIEVIFTPDLYVETAGSILTVTFIGMTVITSLVLKYRRRVTAMIRRIFISFGVGLVELAFVYGTLFAPSPGRFVKEAAIDIVVSASLASVVTFVFLSLPGRFSDEWRRAVISLSVAFFAAVIIGTSIVSFVEEMNYKKGMSIFAGVFIATAVVTSLVLMRTEGRK